MTATRKLSLPYLYEMSRRKPGGRLEFSFGMLASPFEVRSVGSEYAPVVASCDVFQRHFQLRAYEGVLYRPAILAHPDPAPLVDMERATADEICSDPTQLDDPEEATEWFDHPGYIVRTCRAREDPWRKAPSRQYWRGHSDIVLDNDDVRREQVQKGLDSCLVIDDMLWRPTSAPGKAVFVYDKLVVVEDWLPGLTHLFQSPVFFDRHESDAAEHLIDRLSVRAEIVWIKQVERKPLAFHGESYWTGYYADMAMVRSTARALAGLGKPVAAFGSGVAAAYWRLTTFPAYGRPDDAADLLRFVQPDLTGCGHNDIVGIGASIAKRFRSLEAAG
ncbi:MAG: hypothetical protein P0Y65_17105 [Candidatus Devosia phytovorans]|uniref:Uncharacterized protein n=1 Tax=Candidatus Devosia phytovorans TaxID=3121372 RepID=A0AAJ6AYR8_9HYPH|nr:hypothetical protein [Devosia sp.]WEK03890.1 MAG: hypothetical protein P0Y65_17105 [Devosia sp.]